MYKLFALDGWIDGLDVLEPVEKNGLQVFGVRDARGEASPYATLDEALASGGIDVTEVGEAGEVPTIKVANRSATRVFLMAGEELVGAKQNRVLNVSLMIGAKSEVEVPVSCVEAGRWGYRSRKFSSAGTSSHAALRAQMSAQIAGSYRQEGKPTSKQGAVWREIARKLQRMGSASTTSALHKVYEDYQAKLDEMTSELQAPQACSGAVFAFGGRVAGVDIFDCPATLEKLWPKLLRGYAVDALEASRAAKRRRAEDDERAARQLTSVDVAAWLRRARDIPTKRYRSPGLGDDMRLESEELVGASLLVDDRPVHTELFNAST